MLEEGQNIFLEAKAKLIFNNCVILSIIPSFNFLLKNTNY